MHDVYVVSHPHAEHSARDLVGGWYDSRLTPRGRRDARLVAEELQRRRDGAVRPVRITTSDLARCTETAQILAATLDVRVTPDRRLREISFGEAEGRPNDWLAHRQVPAPDHDRLDHRGPIPGAETRREVATRVGACVRELMADLGHDHIVVTHGYAQTFVITTWLLVPVEAAGFASFATEPGAITHLRLDDYWRNRSVLSLADTSHLNTDGV
ncbi:histidine phosphatase family protein [Nocardia sp. NBC_00508]|uniref:histidine phosphatase family protein n=1 Tax=Nocardia sp. NBC_00508 TaxID=2975992 RepID=UPI002E821F87|nr:histidine phosphatase family protein [Nocardia sp. NBC_00508]WUD65769.1 histidine phosphatase family protein [Nocardia sp. NBC_00508]